MDLNSAAAAAQSMKPIRTCSSGDDDFGDALAGQTVDIRSQTLNQKSLRNSGEHIELDQVLEQSADLEAQDFVNQPLGLKPVMHSTLNFKSGGESMTIRDGFDDLKVGFDTNKNNKSGEMPDE